MGMLIHRARKRSHEATEAQATPEADETGQSDENSAPASEAPAKNAAHSEWITYAESLGIDDAVSKTRGELIEATEKLSTK